VSVTVDGGTTQFVYNGDGAMVKMIHPDGNYVEYAGSVYEVEKTSGGTTAHHHLLPCGRGDARGWDAVLRDQGPPGLRIPDDGQQRGGGGKADLRRLRRDTHLDRRHAHRPPVHRPARPGGDGHLLLQCEMV